MLKVLRTFALTALLLLPFVTQAQADCTGLTIPYAENFDSYSGNATGTTAPTGYPEITLPNCWSFLNMSSSTSSYPQVFLSSSSTYAVSGKCLFFKSSSSTPLYAVMPAITYAGEVQLAFQYKNEGTTTSNGTIIVGIMSDASDANTFVGIDTCVKTTTKTLKEIILPANTLSSGARIAFMYLGGTSNNYYAAIDNVVLQVPPTCFQVTNLAVSNITTTSITLSWTDAINTGATYTIYNMADTSVVANNISGTSYNVTGLTPGTQYRFAVMTDCGDGDVTDLTAPVRGITACVAMNLPYTTSFEEGELIGTTNADALPLCWTRYASGNGSYTYYPYSYNSTSGYAHTGTRCLYFYGGTTTSYPDTMVAIMPPVDVNTFPMNGNRITFWSRTTAASGTKTFEVGTLSDPTDMSTFTSIETFTITGTTNTFFSVPLTNATATHPYVAFRALRSGSYLCIDDVTLEEMPSCLEVSNLAASNITSSSVTLTWEDNLNTGATYTIISTVSNNVYASNVTGTTYTVTGLTPNTLYSFGVRANCTNGDSTSVMSVTARTACGTISIPYSTGFEASELVGTANVDALPFCWTRYASGTGSYTYYPYSYSSSTYAHGSSRSLYFYGTTSTAYPDTMVAILPAVDVTTYPMNGNKVSFYARSYSSSSTKSFQVGTMSDPTDISTFIPVTSFTVSGSTYELYSVPLSTAPATNAYIAIFALKEGNYLYIDDLTIELLPNCVEPVNLTATPNGTSADITWTGSATSYTITLYNNNVEVGTPVTVTTNSYTFTGLTLDQDYVVSVVSNCGSEVSSAANASFHIGYCTPNPTSVDNSGITNVTFGNMTNTTSHPSSAPYYINNSAMAGSVPAGTTATVDITYATGYTYGTIIWVDWNNSMTFEGNEVVYVGTSNNTNPTVLTATFDIPATTPLGNYRMRIAGADSYFDSYTGSIAAAANANPCFSSSYAIAEDYTLTITEAPSCLAPTGVTASNVTAHDVTLTWTSDANNFKIYNMADDSAPVLVGTATTNSYSITGLSGETNYTFGVATVCGTDESTITTVSFTTLISCPVPTALSAALTPGNGSVATLNWTAGGEETSWQICINDDMTNLITTNTNSYNLTGLTAEQTYTAKVRAICSVDDQSVWSSTLTFVPTDAYSITVNDGTTTNSYIPIYGLYVDEITRSKFIIPAADLAVMQFGAITKLTFYASQANVPWTGASFNVYLTETTETSVSALAESDYASMTQVYAGSLSIVNNKMEVTFNTPYTYMGGNLMVGFLETTTGTYSSSSWYGVSASGASMSNYGSGSASQRNFLPKTTIDYNPGTLPDCLPVTALSAGNITASSATLSWNGDAASYNVYSITATDTTLVQNVTTTSISLSGLNAMTQYTYGVRAVCSSDMSTLVMVTFNTACAALSLPYTETFETTSPALSCWSVEGSGNWTIGVGDYSTSTGAFQGSSNAKITHGTTGNTTKFVSPVLNAVNNGLSLDFAYVMRSWSGDLDELRVYSRASETATWQQVAEYTTEAATWTVASVVIPGTVYQVAFEYTDNYGYGLGIDSVVFTEMTSSYCYPVTDLTVTATTTSSVSLSWTDANNSGATYSIFADNGNVVATNVTGTSYTITGLTPATTYTFGVITNCSADNTSNVVTISATTECLSTAINLPFTETFATTSATRNCWTIIDGDGDGFAWSTLLEGTEIEAMTSLSYDNATYNALTPNNWLISPKLHTNAGATITLGWTVESAPSYPAEHYGVYVSTTTTDTTSFTLINEWTLTSGTATPMNVDLSTYAGQDIYIAFRHFNCTDMYVLVIDDVNLFEGAYVPDTLTMTFAVNNASMGTTTPAPGTYQYIEGDTVYFSATPNAGYSFYGWQLSTGNIVDTIVGYQNAYVPANAWMSYGAVTMTAIFEGNAPEILTLTLAVNDASMGTTSPVPGTYTYADGEMVTISATPYDGFTFIGWLKSAAGYTDTIGAEYINLSFPASSMMNYGSMTMTALFSPDTFVVENYFTMVTAVNDATMGTMTPAPGTYNLSAGDIINFSASPYDGYIIESVHLAILYMGFPFLDTIITEEYMDLFNEPLEVTEDMMGATMYFTVNFAVDRPNGISDVNSIDFYAFSQNGNVVLKGAEGHEVYLFDINGRMLHHTTSANETELFNTPASGVYLIKVDNVTKRVVVIK